jgi:hypothetical protein
MDLTIPKGTNFNSIDERKIEACIPLGLPDFEAQLSYFLKNRIKIEQPHNWNRNKERYELYSKFFLNRHRYSTYERDADLARILYRFYSHIFNGYATRMMWPSKFHDGLFNREICLFDPMQHLILTSKSGGNPDCPRIVNGDTWNRMAHVISDKDWDAIDKKFFHDVDVSKIYILDR